jgi:hypothetical protein
MRVIYELAAPGTLGIQTFRVQESAFLRPEIERMVVFFVNMNFMFTGKSSLLIVVQAIIMHTLFEFILVMVKVV